LRYATIESKNVVMQIDSFEEYKTVESVEDFQAVDEL